MADFGLMIAAIYFSSLMYVIVHVLGMISGALAGWLLPGVSIKQGAVVGLICALLVLVVILLMQLATPSSSQGYPSFVLWAIALSPAMLATALPPIALWAIRTRLWGPTLLL